MKISLSLSHLKQFFLAPFRTDSIEESYKKFFWFSPFQIGLNILIRTIITVGVTTNQVLFYFPVGISGYIVRYSLLVILSLVNLLFVLKLLRSLNSSGGGTNLSKYLKYLLWADAILSFWFVFSIITKWLIWAHWKKTVRVVIPLKEKLEELAPN